MVSFLHRFCQVNGCAKFVRYFEFSHFGHGYRSRPRSPAPTARDLHWPSRMCGPARSTYDDDVSLPGPSSYAILCDGIKVKAYGYAM